MSIERVIVKNYRTLADVDIRLRPDFNIIVGDNESGKSTLLEAINLALKCQINRRSAAYELHPYLFNMVCVARYIESLRNGLRVPPPEILVELYLGENANLPEFRGINNSLGENVQGISLTIRLDEENFGEEYRRYIDDPLAVETVPIEYYKPEWQTFAGKTLDPNSMRLRSSLIDPGSISDTYAAGRYIVEFTREYLTKDQKVGVALSYRKLRGDFAKEQGVIKINEGLAKRKGAISDKKLSVAMDMTARAGWEGVVLPYLDEIPISLVGKGEQNSVKIKLAVEAAMDEDRASRIILIEEPENHLSHSRLNQLLDHLASKASGKQVIVTTHSSFVLNKLGVENVLMLYGNRAIKLADLSKPTADYFKKLPVSKRCTQAICDFADKLYPGLPKTKSLNNKVTGHDGVFAVPRSRAARYIDVFHPQPLRYDRRSKDIPGRPINFGSSKGMTFDRTLIYPHEKLKKFLLTGVLEHAGRAIAKIYVAVTRARQSTAFVIPDGASPPSIPVFEL